MGEIDGNDKNGWRSSGGGGIDGNVDPKKKLCAGDRCLVADTVESEMNF